MPLSIARIMEVAAPAAMQAMHRPYSLSQITEAPDFDGYRTALFHRGRQAAISINWLRSDEVGLVTEVQKVEFVRRLLDNAVNTLDAHLARDLQWGWNDNVVPVAPEPPPYDDDVKTVDFGGDW